MALPFYFGKQGTVQDVIRYLLYVIRKIAAYNSLTSDLRPLISEPDDFYAFYDFPSFLIL